MKMHYPSKHRPRSVNIKAFNGRINAKSICFHICNLDSYSHPYVYMEALIDMALGITYTLTLYKR